MLEHVANLQKESSRIVTAPLASSASPFPGSCWVAEGGTSDTVTYQAEVNPEVCEAGCSSRNPCSDKS